jgi:hypothetical protein
MPQPPVNPSSGYPDPNAPSYPSSEQPGYHGSGEPSYGAYGQPAGQPSYGTYGQPADQPPYGTYGQPAGQPPYGTYGQPAGQPPYGTYGQPAGQPPYGTYGQPVGQPEYQGGYPPSYPQTQPSAQSYPGLPQPGVSREAMHSNPASAPGRRKRSLGSWFSGLSTKNKFRVILVAVTVLVLPFAIYLGLDEPNQADVGDCMAGKGASDLRIVSCSDASAEWKVLGRLEGKTKADQDGACNAHAGTTASFYQDGRRFRKGFILCLGPAKK